MIILAIVFGKNKEKGRLVAKALSTNVSWGAFFFFL